MSETILAENRALVDAEKMAAEHENWNFWVSVWDTVFIMAGLSIISRDTIMPALMTHLTDSKMAIGLIAALHNLGMYLPQLFVANRTERIRYKLPYLVWGSALFERGPYLLIAGAIWWFAKPSPMVTLLLFFVLLMTSALTIGFLVPAWYDMIAKVIPVNRRGRYSGIGHALGALLSMGCAYWAGTVLDKVAYPNNFALLFLAAYGVMFLSWIALALTREPPSVMTKQHIPFARFMSELPTILRRDRNYARFLLSRTTIQLGMLANGFFIVYGIERFGIDGIFIGNLTVVLVATQAVMSLVWGYVADRTGYKTLLAAAAFALAAAAAVALVAQSAIWLVAVYVLLGIYTGADYVAGLNIILEFSPPEDRPTYIGLTNSLLAPSLTLGPLIGGWLAGVFGYSGLFLTALVIVLIGGLMMTLLVREPRKK